MMRSGLKDTALDNGSGVGGVLRQDGGDSDGGNLNGGNLDGGNSNCGKLDTGDTTLAALEAVVTARVSLKQSNFFSVRTETNRNSICFGCFLVCFAKPKNLFFGSFWFVSVFRTGIETTETNRIFSKQTKKISRNILY
jgi:hypothetical protein